MSWFVYLVRCCDGSLYCGSTNDLERRVHEHNHGTRGARYTRGRRPVALVWSQRCRDRSHAMARELFVKGLTAIQKRTLIAREG